MPASTPLNKQSSILGFFGKSAQKKDGTASASTSSSPSTCLKETTKANCLAGPPRNDKITPVPSSDPVDPLGSQENRDVKSTLKKSRTHLPTPETPAVRQASKVVAVKAAEGFSSPSRRAKKAVSYAEDSDEEDEDVFASLKARQARGRNRESRARTMVDDDDEDDYKAEAGAEVDEQDDDMEDFVVSDESDAPSASKKRKKPSKGSSAPRKRQAPSSALPEVDMQADDADIDLESERAPSTAQQWRYDPDNIAGPGERPSKSQQRQKSTAPKAKEKAHTRDPEQRYPWLANATDLNRNPAGHPDFDPSTIFVPEHAMKAFSPFERQYWEIKQKLWDTVVFFKKGKFYELYENDATIGHQLFDLKLTDRVNMRMVGVPEGTLDMWVNQFIAKGYKVARVDQMESALGKEMRERDPKAKKEQKIIRRELASILTGGTLVDGSMLQDDMAVYCAAIKESVEDDKPMFGIAFVDCATGRFFLSQFEDDANLTRFETFVAQIGPRELLLEKGRLSTRALRILKNNTAPTTIWNHMKPGLDFWDAELTRREVGCSGYFISDENLDDRWPSVLEEMRNEELVLSAFGALTQYLRTLKIDKTLISQQNFERFYPIHRNGTLVLDGQTLINLEIFSNTANGGPEGSLFTLLNQCITPFGKRMFRQWVCHPLQNIAKINERLDAVDLLNADRSMREQFSSQMVRMPDLERLISRVHAGACRPDEFVKVLEGFEQIEYTLSLLGTMKQTSGIVGELLKATPDLREPLGFWKAAFDRKRAREDRLLIPQRGIEEDFDESADNIERIKKELDTLLTEQKAALKCKDLKFANVGNEIYQIEASSKVKVPKEWRQMSSTATLKRYYFRDLDLLVRELQEAEEMHSQLVREVNGRFYKRFDVDMDTWLLAIRITAQLDCLIGLAKASMSLGQPSCRPVFVDDERSVIEFEELRHPCMLNTVDDFIPNDIKLGGNEANINLLTGANAAGKSTVLRMTCTAVIMAQIGCYVPAISARLTPVDRIMSRLGANDNIFAAQSTFFVELSETKKILSEATPRSLVILDELGRGTSSYDGVAVAQAVLHHVASHIGCIGFFATHYHSLATEFEHHPEVRARRMQIHVDDANRRITFLYRLEDGVAEGSFGMHCAAMCGISDRVIERAEVAAKEWEHTSRLKDSLDRAKTGCYIPLGVLSDVSTMLRLDDVDEDSRMNERSLQVLMKAIGAL